MSSKSWDRGPRRTASQNALRSPPTPLLSPSASSSGCSGKTAGLYNWPTGQRYQQSDSYRMPTSQTDSFHDDSKKSSPIHTRSSWWWPRGGSVFEGREQDPKINSRTLSGYATLRRPCGRGSTTLSADPKVQNGTLADRENLFNQLSRDSSASMVDRPFGPNSGEEDMCRGSSTLRSAAAGSAGLRRTPSRFTSSFSSVSSAGAPLIENEFDDDENSTY